MNKKEFLEFEKEMRELIKSQKEEKKISDVVKLIVPNWDVSCGYHVFNMDFDFQIEIEWCKDWDMENELKKYINYLVKEHCIPVNHLSTQGEIKWNKDHIILDYGMCLELSEDPNDDCKWTDNVWIKIENPKKKTSKKK